MARRYRLPFRIPFFRIFYSTTYTTLFVIVLVLLAITPASLIFNAIQSNAYQYIFMIGGAYVLVASLTVFAYSSRLYTNRSVLAGVGKSWIPVQEGEVSRNVRKIVVRALERSAMVALETKPRDLSKELALVTHKEYDQDCLHEHHNLISSSEDGSLLFGNVVTVDPRRPPWGAVAHAGWSSPSAVSDTTSTPHLCYSTVIQEIPNLVEARAVSLGSDHQPAAQRSLRRPEAMGLRDYMTYLDSLGLIYMAEAVDLFLDMYEHARFSAEPLFDTQFRDLMASFSDLLNGMEAISVSSSSGSSKRNDPDAASLASSSPRSTTSGVSTASAIRHPARSSRIASMAVPRFGERLGLMPSHSSPTLGRYRQDSTSSVIRNVRSRNGSFAGSSLSSV